MNQMLKRQCKAIKKNVYARRSCWHRRCSMDAFKCGCCQEGNTSTFEVIRGDFLVSVTAGGTLEAVNQEVIRNEVDGIKNHLHHS